MITGHVINSIPCGVRIAKSTYVCLCTYPINYSGALPVSGVIRDWVKSLALLREFENLIRDDVIDKCSLHVIPSICFALFREFD